MRGASDRFFLAAVLGGRLHPDGIPEWGSWDSSRLHWWSEDHPNLILTITRERKVRTAEELEAAMKEPMGVAPTRNVWIHENLEDEASRWWETYTAPSCPEIERVRKVSRKEMHKSPPKEPSVLVRPPNRLSSPP
jgi:hypothetical protein